MIAGSVAQTWTSILGRFFAVAQLCAGQLDSSGDSHALPSQQQV